MLAPSFRVVPLLRETEPRSDPARSTSVSLPSWCSSSMPLARVARARSGAPRASAATGRRSPTNETARRALPRPRASRRPHRRERARARRGRRRRCHSSGPRAARPPLACWTRHERLLAIDTPMFSLADTKYERGSQSVFSTSAWLIAQKTRLDRHRHDTTAAVRERRHQVRPDTAAVGKGGLLRTQQRVDERACWSSPPRRSPARRSRQRRGRTRSEPWKSCARRRGDAQRAVGAGARALRARQDHRHGARHAPPSACTRRSAAASSA